MRAQSDARAALAVGLLAAVVFVVLAVLVVTPFGIAFDGAVLGGVQETATRPVVAAMGLLTRLGNEFIIVAGHVALGSSVAWWNPRNAPIAAGASVSSRPGRD